MTFRLARRFLEPGDEVSEIGIFDPRGLRPRDLHREGVDVGSPGMVAEAGGLDEGGAAAHEGIEDDIAGPGVHLDDAPWNLGDELRRPVMEEVGGILGLLHAQAGEVPILAAAGHGFPIQVCQSSPMRPSRR